MAANRNYTLLGIITYQIQTNLYNVKVLKVTTTLLITPLHSVASESILASVFHNPDNWFLPALPGKFLHNSLQQSMTESFDVISNSVFSIKPVT
jgi:hypothetical protein